MQFKDFNEKIKSQFNEICKLGKLFKTEMNGAEVWDLYINSFKPENDPIFRDPDSSTNNCNTDKSFIRRYGNIVSIDENYKIVTMFDIDLPDDCEFYDSAKAVREALKNSKIKDVFFETFDELKSLPYERCNKNQNTFRLGIEENHKIYTQEEADKFGVVTAGKVYKFNHFNVDLSSDFVDKTGKSAEAIIGEFRDAKNVFQRAMQEISLDTLFLVQDLINQGSLLNGDAHIFKIKEIIPMKESYDKISSEDKDNWCWVNSYKFPFAKFRNELIGTLCVELSQGEELNNACKTWNKRVDPANYMKAKAPITQKQINEAHKFVDENGYFESFDRRFATIDDIDVSEIIHVNSVSNKIKTASIFDKVKPSLSTRHKRSQFNNIEEVSIDKFMKDILPTCTSIEAFFENRFSDNLVTMTTAKNKNSKNIFKWSNNYSWTYNGNLTGKSMIKDAVKEKGGKIDGVLRFSIMWAEGETSDNSDLDAWAVEPDGTKIGYNTSYRKDRGNFRTKMSGQLDVDITTPSYYNHKNIVENIAWINKDKMKDGVYKLWVNQFLNRGSKGFKAEIEFDGEIYTYEYNMPVSGNVNVAEVTLKNGEFSIKHHLQESNSSKELWGVSTNQFHKVNLVCLSPNHWGDNNFGNKHYFFMIDGCRSDNPMRSFHNENLSSDLLLHRKVMEVLGETNKLNPSKEQLAGIGFNSTIKDELIVKISGSFKRMIKIKF